MDQVVTNHPANTWPLYTGNQVVNGLQIFGSGPIVDANHSITTFINCEVVNVEIVRLRGYRIRFFECGFCNVVFNECVFNAAVFVNCNFDSCTFTNMHYSGTAFTGGRWRNTHPFKNPAHIRSVSVHCVQGDGMCVQTGTLGNWNVLITKEHVQVGCKSFHTQDVADFVYDRHTLLGLDAYAPEWWEYYGTTLQTWVKGFLAENA